MTELLAWLHELDNQIFLSINHGMSHFGLDLLFTNITDLHKVPWFKWIVVPLLLALIIFLRKKAGVFIIFGLMLAVGLTDLIGGKLIKPYFARLRPNLTDLDVILRSPHFGGSSFTSNHASNIFCMMVFLSVFFPKARGPLLTFAFLVALSRVYVGVHYPSDVLIGAVWGGLLGYLMARGTQKVIQKYQSRGSNG